MTQADVSHRFDVVVQKDGDSYRVIKNRFGKTGAVLDDNGLKPLKTSVYGKGSILVVN